MSNSFSNVLLLAVLVLCGIGSPGFGAAEAPLFAVKFSPNGASFSGSVPDEETGQALAEAVNAVRPDLRIINEGIQIDPDVVLPDLLDLKSLIAELGISTHEGGIAIWDDSILLSGLTDSVITVAALKIRLEPLLGDRDFINRICIVHTDDLPDLTVKLSSGEAAGPLIDFDYYPTAEEMFEAPGIRLEKIFSTMVMLSDLTVFDESQPPLSPGGTTPDGTAQDTPSPLRAVPLMTSGSRNPPFSAEMLRAVPSAPANTYVELEPIRFARNSFLLQANQSTAVNTITKQLREPTLAGKKILLRPVRFESASAAYGDYILEKRGEETRRLLTEHGIPRSRITIEKPAGRASVDEGIVRVVVEVPPPPPPDEMESDPVPDASGDSPPAGKNEGDSAGSAPKPEAASGGNSASPESAP